MEKLRAVGIASAKGQAPLPLPLVSAFATTSRRGLGQTAVEGKPNQAHGHPARRDRRAEKDGLKGAIVAMPSPPFGAAIIRVAARTRQRTAAIASPFAGRCKKSRHRRRIAINLRRAATANRSIKRRKQAGWDKEHRAALLSHLPC